MRLFIGLDIPQQVQTNLDALINALRPAARLRWSLVGNLHVTTKFIGEWPENRLDELKAALAAVHSPALPISIRGLGWFPNPHSPRVFFAAIRAPESLAQLAAATQEAVFALGIEKETRRYSPHLTLARIQEATDLSEVRRRVAALPSDEFGEFTAHAFHLYLSRPEAGGSVYSKLATYPLT